MHDMLSDDDRARAEYQANMGPGFDPAAMIGGGGDAGSQLAEALIATGARFSGPSLAALIWVHENNPELAQFIERQASRWSNPKVIMEAIKSWSLEKFMNKLNLGGGLGGGK